MAMLELNKKYLSQYGHTIILEKRIKYRNFARSKYIYLKNGEAYVAECINDDEFIYVNRLMTPDREIWPSEDQFDRLKRNIEILEAKIGNYKNVCNQQVDELTELKLLMTKMCATCRVRLNKELEKVGK